MTVCSCAEKAADMRDSLRFILSGLVDGVLP
jgi:hypothetical protein